MDWSALGLSLELFAATGRPPRPQKWSRRARESGERMSASAYSFAIPKLGEGLIDLVNNHETKKEAIAVVIESEIRGERQSRSAGNVPGKHRASIVRCVGEAKAIAISQAAVHFRSEGKVLAAKDTPSRACGQGKSATCAQRIAELPGAAGEILFRNDIFRNVPSLEITGQNELELDLALFLAAIVAPEEIRTAVVSYNFEQRLIRTIDVFELEVKHRV